MKANQEQRRVKRTFLGEGNSETYRKGQIINLEPQRAAQYDARGLTEAVKDRPTTRASQAANADHKTQVAKAEAKKASGPAENKAVAPSATKGK